MTLPPPLAASPRLSQWIQLDHDGNVVIWTGKVEFGQGIHTALAQVVAEELDIDIARIRVAAVSTAHSPDEGYTAGSLSVQQSGAALRQVSTQVKTLLIAAAKRRMSSEAVTATNGRITDEGTGRMLTYGELACDISLDCDVSGVAEAAVVAHPAASVLRRDLAAKLRGRPSYVHDLRQPGQLYGRILRPPSRAAVLHEIDPGCLAGSPAKVVVIGNFVGVIAEREFEAMKALTRLRSAAVWDEVDSLPDQTNLDSSLMCLDSDDELTYSTAKPPSPPANGVRTLTARYFRPHLAHASIAPSAAVAQWDPENTRVSVWTHSQGIFPLRSDLARALELPLHAVTVSHVEGAGCYGHNGADDAAYDAALLARAVLGRPVHVTWSRADELGWAPLAPAMVVDLEADLTPANAVTRWSYESWGGGHSSRPSSLPSPALLGYAHQSQGHEIPPAQDPPFARGGGATRNAVPPYAVGEISVRTHRLRDAPLRTSAMRALGAHLNVFATESLMDELAEAASSDPLDFRIDRLQDERARAVLREAARASGWGKATAGDATGKGIGYARYKNTGAWCAVVAEIEAQSAVTVRRLTIAVDVGRAINPDGVINQIEGGAIQAASWTTREKVLFDRRRVVSDSWETYPILNFTEVPKVNVILIDRPAEPSLGAGEASVGPTAAAIGNAVYAALGLRIRTLPLTREAVLRAIG